MAETTKRFERDRIPQPTFVWSGWALLRGCGILLALLNASIAASAPPDHLRFAPSDSQDVTGYLIHWSDQADVRPATATATIDIALDFRFVDGIASVPLDRILDQSAYVVMQAYDSEGLYSTISNEIHVSLDTPVCESSSDCSDGDTCNGTERCVAGSCIDGEVLVCRDEGPCRASLCDPLWGCRTSDVAEGTTCDDDDPQTIDDSCQAGVCQGEVLSTQDASQSDRSIASVGSAIVDLDHPWIFEDFEGVSLGDKPRSWTTTHANGQAYPWKLRVFERQSGEKSLGFKWSNEADYFGHLDAEGSAVWSAYEFSGRLFFEDPEATIGVSVLSRLLEGEGHIALRRDANSPSFRLQLQSEDDEAFCFEASDVGFTPEAGVPIRFRIQTWPQAQGLRVQARFWNRQEAEPIAWSIDCVSPNHRDRQGRPGLIIGGQGAKFFDDLLVRPIEIAFDDSTPEFLYTEDFSDFASGGHLTGWTDRSNRLASGGPEYFYRTIPDGEGEEVLFTYTLAGQNFTSHLVSAGSESWTDYEFSGRLMTPYAPTPQGVLIYDRLSLGGGAIALLKDAETSIFKIRKLGYPDARCLGEPNTGFIAQPTLWSRFRIRVKQGEFGLRVLAKLWTMLDPEPDGWQADCRLDSSAALPSGSIGVWASAWGASFWDDFEVIRIGDQPER